MRVTICIFKLYDSYNFLEKLVDKAQDLAEKAKIESEGHCPIARNQIKHELEKRGMSSPKIEKVITKQK